MSRLKVGQLRQFNENTALSGQVILVTRRYHDMMAPRAEFILNGKQHKMPEQHLLSDTSEVE